MYEYREMGLVAFENETQQLIFPLFDKLIFWVF